ncbi:MAG: hypothetical protein HRT44_02535 [Bdellovibrionales bacterium]|nr:hypothetical protein [Bdellovibrionales bacterium]NQZ18125.1 hypothetical protein [Bdellovibrionales bacterium]
MLIRSLLLLFLFPPLYLSCLRRLFFDKPLFVRLVLQIHSNKLEKNDLHYLHKYVPW